MSKKYGCILIIVLLLITCSLFIKDDTKIFETDGVKYAISVNGEKKNSFPNKGTYFVNIECSNAESKWNYQEWVAEIHNITGKVTCDISFTENEKVTLAEYLKNKVGTDGIYKITDNGEEDYRYRGENPNNYVMFNNELWRIIGVFDDNTHSITDTHLVKIIRNSSIGGYVWNRDYNNNFPSSSIYKILTAYFNHQDVTNEDYCYDGTAAFDATGKCDFTKIGIQTEYQNMVETTVNWFLGGTNHYELTSSEMYKNEKTVFRVSKNNKTTHAAGITVPVGLMYASDYGYSLVGSVELESYGGYGHIWLHSYRNEATITHSTSPSAGVSYIYYTGAVGGGDVREPYAIRPTLYLKSDVYYISGTGTQADPYIIDI